MIYTVEKVLGKREGIEIKGSQFTSYSLQLAEHPTPVEILQKPDTPAPSGQIEGIIEAGKEKSDGSRWPDKLKRAQKQQGFRPRDPKETSSIVRQHSQEMAIRWVAFVEKPLTLDELKDVIDWFQQDVTGTPSEGPTEPPKATREAAPRIPKDRADRLREKLRTSGIPVPTVQAKLTAVGVQSGKVDDLSVDQAEDVEKWLAHG